MKTILITGSEGYIGKQFTHKFKDHFDFLTIDLKGEDSLTHTKAPYLDALDQFQNKKIDAVLHLAALVGFLNNSPEDFFTENLFNTSKLVEWSTEKGINTFLYASTQAVYANIALVSKEGYQEDITELAHPYAMSKLYSEHSVETVTHPYIFRQATVCGANYEMGHFGFPDKMAKSVIENQSLKVIGPDKLRSLILLDDLINIYHDCITDRIPPGIYNASFIDTSIGETGQLMADYMNERKYTHSYKVTENENDPNISYHAEGKKIREFYTPICDTAESLVQIVGDRWINNSHLS